MPCTEIQKFQRGDESPHSKFACLQARGGSTTCTALSFLVLAVVAYLTFIDKPPASRVIQSRQPLQSLPAPTIHLSADPGRPARFEVHHLPADLLARLAG